jgi:hypothetical protein
MMPLVDKLIAEGAKIQKLEVWHDEANAARMQELDHGKCGGVPFFINTGNEDFICGEADERRLRAWAGLA